MVAPTLKNYEKKSKELEAIVAELDSGDLSLQDMLIAYKKGLSLVKDCTEILSSTETEVEQLIEEVRIQDTRA